MKKVLCLAVVASFIIFCFLPVVSSAGDIESLAKSCIACHKPGATGKKLDLTTLSKKDFLEKMKEFKDSDEGSFMGKKAKGLSDQQINDLADYFQKK